MWRKVRILVLLLVLLFVALNTYFDRVYSTDWNIPLRIAVYPINGDGTEQAARFVDHLNGDSFVAVEAFFHNEAKHYGLAMERPVQFTLAPELHDQPPSLERGAAIPSVMLWSLRMRYWAWRVDEPPGPSPDIKLFLLYHDPQRTPALAHSLGMQKGLYGVVHLFAENRMAGSNDVVMAHELLHTLGATDKYDLHTNQPLNPIGYAEPDRRPLLPQQYAELMGGRIPVSADDSEMPESLSKVVVGTLTAAEIRWSKP
jgi:hypothetical protein